MKILDLDPDLAFEITRDFRLNNFDQWMFADLVIVNESCTHFVRHISATPIIIDPIAVAVADVQCERALTFKGQSVSTEHDGEKHEHVISGSEPERHELNIRWTWTLFFMQRFPGTSQQQLLLLLASVSFSTGGSAGVAFSEQQKRNGIYYLFNMFIGGTVLLNKKLYC